MKLMIEQVNLGLLLVIEAGITFKIIKTLIAAQADGESIKQAFEKCKKLIIAGALAICIEEVLKIVKGNFLDL